MTVIGLDLGLRDTAQAGHWLAALPPVPGLVACTHLVHGRDPRVVVTIDGPAGLVTATDSDAVRAAAEDHATGRAGRAVIFPGVRELTGTLTVGDLLARSVITEVTVLGGPPAHRDTLIDTRDFVRPQWKDGRLVLIAAPAPGGRIAPFEVPNPTPCCGGDH